MTRKKLIPKVEISFKRKYSERLVQLFIKSIANSLAEVTDEYVAKEKDKKSKQQEGKTCR